MLPSRSTLLALAAVILLGPPSPARAQLPLALIPPVDAPVTRAFEAPATEFGSGHRGIDYVVPAGTAVRAAASGTVAYAGSVAGHLAVTIEHGSGLETTYSELSSISVTQGAQVGEGAWIGRSGTAHDSSGLHFGVKLEGAYVDPESLLGALDVTGAIHLAPLNWEPEDMGGLEMIFPPPSDAGEADRFCEERGPLPEQSFAPNDNVAVAVAGITSKTKDGIDATIYEAGPLDLGYDPARIYRFSFRGIDGPRFHEPYERTDTYINLNTAATRLRKLMTAIHRKHPGAHVDLIAHSQGGVVARLYLARHATSWDDSLPQVEHFVTYSSPHRGALAAGEIDQIDDGSLAGSWVLDRVSSWSESAPIPDPRSDAVSQLAPDSELMKGLASEDVSYGTRVLTLAIPNDPVVPADRASIDGEYGRIVPWEGNPLGGHKAIVTSDAARSVAYSFLADGAPRCKTGWDSGGEIIGWGFSRAQSNIAEMYRSGEKRVAVSGLSLLRVPPKVGRLIYDGAVTVKSALRGR